MPKSGPSNPRPEQSLNSDPGGSSPFIPGKVLQWFPDSWTARVMYGGPDNVVDAVWIAGSFFSTQFGLEVNFHPEVNSHVLLAAAADGEFYIIGSLPDASSFDANSQEKPKLGVTAGPNSQAHRGSAVGRRDRATGEADFLNSMGVGVSFQRFLATLRGSDLAKISAHLLDDLVQIVSLNFQHVTSLGECEVRADGGRPNMVWRGSSKEYETEGRDGPSGALPESNDPWTNKARERFGAYLGALGNMFHLWVNEPAASLGALAAGRFRTHINEDGTFLLQSQGDIIFEKAIRIPIPAQQDMLPEDDKTLLMEWEPDPKLQSWIPSDPENLYHEAYKLRDHARWLNYWYSLAQFHRREELYKTPKGEAECPAPTVDHGEDPERPNAGYEDAHAQYVNSFATIRILRDGSIVLYDGYRSSIHLGGGDVTVSATRDLRLEAARDIVSIAGRDTFITSHKNALVRTEEGDIALEADGGMTLTTKRNQLALISESLRGIVLTSPLGPVLMQVSDFFVTARNITLNALSQLRQYGRIILSGPEIGEPPVQAQLGTSRLDNTTFALYKGKIACDQVIVRKPIEIPQLGAQSLVLGTEDLDTPGEQLEDFLVDAEDYPDMWEIPNGLNEDILEVFDDEEREQLSLLPELALKDTEFPQSLTQQALEVNDTHPSLELNYTQWPVYEVTMEMQHLSYKPTDPSLSTASGGYNRNGAKSLTPEAFSFSRVMDDE